MCADWRTCAVKSRMAVFAFVAGFLAPVFVTPIRSAVEKHQNLVGYRDRILQHYFQG